MPRVDFLKSAEFNRLAGALVFLVAIYFFIGGWIAPDVSGRHLLIIAAVIGGYMAMNIGANDVANNVGPAVGAAAMTMLSAIIIAGMFEAGGALIAGGDVVSTIKKGIIDPALIRDSATFIWAMMAALLAAAIWLNVATYVGAPVSTTHSIVGGVLGAGIAAGGWGIVNWATMGKIAASWVISPLLGGVIAASVLYLIKNRIVYKKDKLAEARKDVPLLLSAMAFAFATYLVLKGLKKLWKFDFLSASAIGLVVAIAVFFITRPLIARAAEKLPNDRASINKLFAIPLVFAAALLSFAHGANDVANAVGPLAAINDALSSGDIATKAAIPLWVMVIGALGIALGLTLYGPKLIRTVGSEITELDMIRAFCVAMAASVTVIIASQLGLPVSSTHIAVGGVFGVGFLREFLDANHQMAIAKIRKQFDDDAHEDVEGFLDRYEEADIIERGEMLVELKKLKKTDAAIFSKAERKRLGKAHKKELVKRSLVYKIAAAWVITVPAAAFMSAFFFFAIRGMMLP
ncbi:MAG TPA: inorganic phosphate transporter [Rhizobiales bacterium]|nr:inorganic phosphate transporter [Hyphomicrobiales bacterium]